MDDIQIVLSKDEALILLDFLSRFSNINTLEIQDPSEEQVLWNLTCSLEKVLPEPFSEQWLSIIQDARQRLGNES